MAIAKKCEFVPTCVEDGGCHVLRMALEFKVEGQNKTDWPRRTWKKQVEVESMKVCLSVEDAICRSKWTVGVIWIAFMLR